MTRILLHRPIIMTSITTSEGSVTVNKGNFNCADNRQVLHAADWYEYAIELAAAEQGAGKVVDVRRQRPFPAINFIRQEEGFCDPVTQVPLRIATSRFRQDLQ